MTLDTGEPPRPPTSARPPAGQPAAPPPLHLARRRRVVEPDPAGAHLMHALDAIDYGVMLVDANASVLHANAAAARHTDARGALQLVDGRVAPRSAAHAEPFRRAVAAALVGRRSLLALTMSGGSACVAFVPLRCDAPADAESRSVLLLLGKREPCQGLSVQFFAQTHGLTPAEGTVLRGLCEGLQPAEIAAVAGVKISTVRTQIGSLRSKTRATSIGEVVRMVAQLPPMAPVLYRQAA